jgi:hypothetical protein
MKKSKLFLTAMAAFIAVIFSALTRCATDGGNQAPVLGTSTDEQPGSASGLAIAWTVVEDNTFGDSTISALAYGGEKFVAGGGGGNDISKMAYSTDGVTWTKVETSPFDGGISGIAYGGDKFVAGGNGGKIAYSNKVE